MKPVYNKSAIYLKAFDAFDRADYQAAFQELRLLAEQGDASAQFNLGQMYQEGRGVAQSDAEAVKWFRKSAEQGDANAQFNLGSMYRNGLGVTQSDTEAVKW